ncbi:phospholipase D-like domain-containing protein [Priestia endophytica]|uniref:phospholipase D-like domain-containing protein n=1 Tax=Priestia endophytica TaxID=135735 RepID=UPI0020421A93|nr:phospholipase D family protein [Priestia endophytica]MCM3537355.1 phospholipase D family protein [Priestia endophytica]
MRVKMILKTLGALLFLYLIYTIITAVVLFYLPVKKEKTSPTNMNHFLGTKKSTDRVLLLEDGYNSGVARIKMIQEARHSIDIAYYALGKGESTELILGALIEAADRGVHVRVLLDGISHNLRGKRSGVRYALASHPNIEFKYYEPFTLLKPWTWNNRLHDKIMIADTNISISGGRNIADKYLARTPSKDFVYDRDVVVFNEKHQKDSIIFTMKDYINMLWNHQYTATVFKNLSKSKREKGERVREELKRKYEKAKYLEKDFVNPIFQWKTSTVPTNQVTFIHNPIERLRKKPIVWQKLLALGEQAKESIFIQSPYVIPTKNMEKYIPNKEQEGVISTILTNSLTSTPNPLAFAGYIKSRDEIVQSGVRLYEYEGPHSIHGKSIIYDERLSAVGSFNVDSRSTFLNTESMLLIDSEEFSAILMEAIDDKLSKSTLIAKDKEYVQYPEDQRPNEPALKSFLLQAVSKITVLWRELI